MAKAKITAIQAEKRENTGKGSSRALRRQGKVPAIIYGGKGEEISIAASYKELHKEYMRGNFKSRLFEIELGKDKIRTLPRDIQLHPVTDAPLHADFMRVEDDTKVHVFIPVRFLNREQSPGLKRGGVLSIIRREIELLCRADSIPTVLELDLKGVKIGESLHSHSIDYPEGSQPAIQDRDFTIATIVGKTAEEEEPEEEVVEGEEGAEGAEGEAAEGGEAAPAEGDAPAEDKAE